MIYKGKQLVLEVLKNVLGVGEEAGKKIQKSIGAIYKGSKLVWLTIYNAIKSCYGSGTWLGDYYWISDDTWKNTN